MKDSREKKRSVRGRRIGIFMYYPPAAGGGERYVLTAAEALQSLADVEFLCPHPVDLRLFEEQLGLDLSEVRSIERPFRRFHGYRDWLSRSRYDFFMALDNHLAPFQLCLGRRGVLMLQCPPYAPPFHTPWRSRLKLRTYDRVVVNSIYTKTWALRHGTAGLPIEVIYPPIDVSFFCPGLKVPIILSVGRFFVDRHEKKHPLMIECFRDLVRSGVEGWELHLAGAIREYNPQDVEYLNSLRKMASGLPIRFHVNASLENIRHLYAEASIYWHAAGYGVDEKAHPQHLEHFGISIGEAMAAGAVPIVLGKGGPLEIVTNEKSGFFWETPEELVRRTRQVAKSPESVVDEIRAKAQESVRRFSKECFAKKIRGLVGELLDD